MNTLETSMETITSTKNNETRRNITHLHPGTSIKMRVSAISRFGDLIAVGPASEPLVVSTNAREPHLQGMRSYDKM